MSGVAALERLAAAGQDPIPEYLEKHYWWAYVHPRAVRLFDRRWVLELILFGNFSRLRDAALEALDPAAGETLQVACVYGDFSLRLADRLAPAGTLDVVDVLAIQLRALRRKLADRGRVRLIQCDSSALRLETGSYDQAVVFFLLHEQPDDVRRRTLGEAIRVVRPGGRVVIVDYHLPHRLHPLRYLLPPLLRALEPFALDLWRHPVEHWLPQGCAAVAVRRRTMFGGLYRVTVMRV